MGSVTRLIGELHHGSPDAFALLFERFFPGYVTRLKHRLGPGYPGLEDAEDLALSIFRRLGETVEEDRPLSTNLTDRISLLRILAILTKQKLREAWRAEFRQCRDMRRTVRESDRPAGSPPRSMERTADAALPPDWEVGFLDLLASLLGLLSERQQAIALHKLAGLSSREIATGLGCCQRSVERQLSEIRQRWRAHPDLAEALQSSRPPADDSQVPGDNA